MSGLRFGENANLSLYLLNRRVDVDHFPPPTTGTHPIVSQIQRTGIGYQMRNKVLRAMLRKEQMVRWEARLTAASPTEQKQLAVHISRDPVVLLFAPTSAESKTCVFQF